MNNRIKIRVYVKKTNEFLKKAIQEEINIFDINQNNNHIELIIDKKDLKKIKKWKTIQEYKIINYYGIAKIKNMIQKYKILGFCFIIGILLNMILSNIILQIEVKTPNQALQKQVKEKVSNLGLKPFHWKVSKKRLKEVKKELLNQSKNQIEWLEIEEKGTKYILTVEEKKESKQENCPNRNIVAKKKAMLTEIQADSGEIIKKKYDFVEKGEVIVSGIIHNKEEIVSTKCAKGKILGETWYKVKVEIPKEINNKIKTNQYKWRLSIDLWKKKEGKKDWQVKKEYTIIESKLYPLKISILYLQKIKQQHKYYTIKNVEKKAYNDAEKLLEKHLKNKPTIIQKKVLKKRLKNSKIIVDVFFAIEEDITSYQLISNEEIKEG